MIMMPYNQPWPSLQLTGNADFWHSTGRMTFFRHPTGLIHEYERAA
jgi:hypothetical protein